MGRNAQAPVRELLARAARQVQRQCHADDLVAALVLRESVPGPGEPGPATRVASTVLVEEVDRVWQCGWQPADLMHVVRSRLTRRIARLAETVVVTEADRCGAVSRAPQPWRDQLLALTAAVPPRRDAVAYWRALGAVAPTDAWRAVVRLLALLTGLGPIAALGPTPAQWGPLGPACPDPRQRGRSQDAGPHPRAARQGRVDDVPGGGRVAHRQGPGADDPARSRPCRRRVHARRQARGQGRVPTRVHLDDPYVEAKAQLLGGVGRANDVRVVLHTGHAMATAVGLPLDLDLVECSSRRCSCRRPGR